MLWVAIVLGVVEGLTEFIPVSSTGHLIVASSLLGFEGPRAEVFQIFIQLGAILAVVWEYRTRLAGLARELPRSAASRRFVARIALAFLPSALIGLAVYELMVAHLYNPRGVATALIVGALLMLVVESRPRRVRTQDVSQVSTGQALGIGFAQCLSLWPGFSRSAATILGGLGMGLDRRSATEFSFFLAVPTMFAASFYDLARRWSELAASDLAWLAVTFALAFVVALGSIRWLLNFVSGHSFRIFAWYRIVVGLLILLVLD